MRGLRPGVLLLLMALAGCELRTAMYDQPKYEAMQSSRFFADGLSARSSVEATVARGELDPPVEPGQGFPLVVTPELLARGQERFDIFCVPCHDSQGQGQGRVVQKGFKQPTPLREKRLVDMTEGQLYQIIQNGSGGMMDGMAAQIPVADRWAIVAHLRVLQNHPSVAALASAGKGKP